MYSTFNIRQLHWAFFLLLYLVISGEVSAQYCAKSLPDGFSVFTSRFVLEQIDITSGDGSYSDFTSNIAVLTRGENYVARVTTAVAGSSNPQDGAIYIDWNQDFDFNDSGETISFSALANQTTNVSISVPSNALLGNTRMRVITSFFGNPIGVSPCNPSGSTGFRIGDVEDYTLKVTTPYFSRASGNWNTPGTWSITSLGGPSCNCIPDGCGPVTIGNNNVVSVSNSIDLTTLTIENTGTLRAISDNISFNVEDAIAIRSGGSFDCSATNGTSLNFITGSSSLTSDPGAVTLLDNINANGTTLSLLGNTITLQESLTVNSGNVVNSSTLSINQNLSVTGFNVFSNTATGVVTLNGSFEDIGSSAILSNAGIWSWNGSDFDPDTPAAFQLGFMNVFNYSASADQSVFAGTYNNLNVSGSGVKTLLGAVTVNNIIDINDVSIAIGNHDITIRKEGRATDPDTNYFTFSSGDAGSIIMNGSGQLNFIGVVSGVASIGVRLETSEGAGINSFVYEDQSAISDDFSLHLSEGVRSQGTTGELITSEVVNRTWTFMEATPGNSSGRIFLSWKEGHELPGFNQGELNLYTGSQWTALASGSLQLSDPLVFATLNSFGTFAIDEVSSLLPIELSYFRGEAETGLINLAWETASELNNDYFTIEKSRSGDTWEVLVKIDGSGNSSTARQYVAIDRTPLPGLNYYRLKQTDFDGTTTVVSQIVVDFNGKVKQKSLVHPNPFSSVTTLSFSTSIEDLAIFNLSGKRMDQYVSKRKLNETQYELDFSRLKEGVYFIKVGDASQRILKK